MEHLFPFKSADNHRWSALYYGATAINTLKKSFLFYKKTEIDFKRVGEYSQKVLSGGN